MQPQSSQISDEELANSIDENGLLSSNESNSGDGFLESGESIDVSEEEKFSINDFEPSEATEPALQGELPDAPLTVNDLGDHSPSPETFSSEKEEDLASPESNVTILDGEVAEFRKTLSDLSRQLEIDRLTFLHNRLRMGGKSVPDLASIASDIRGEEPIHPIGDHDIYSKRPFSRLQGWIVGLSFGIGRRAKRFKG